MVVYASMIEYGNEESAAYGRNRDARHADVDDGGLDGVGNAAQPGRQSTTTSSVRSCTRNTIEQNPNGSHERE
ncbi:unnamed protein product [Strongylus vulgaris]|uniref:Uncharacterized protein n=1 Tax=Strongylus vulgaris TaxID=40348 RepID=A0A3P7IPY8_STRVU|nr:unnamed protein product [Strongylus vulgaris]